MRQFVKQDLRLEAGTGPKLDQHATSRDPLNDFARMSGENLCLRTRRIVLRKAGDLLKQLAAALVVEETAGYALLRPRQAIDHGPCELLVLERCPS